MGINFNQDNSVLEDRELYLSQIVTDLFEIMFNRKDPSNLILKKRSLMFKNMNYVRVKDILKTNFFYFGILNSVNYKNYALTLLMIMLIVG